MHAYLHAVRIAPKKANLVAMMVRGMPVPDAVESLRLTHKKAARIIETLLKSAMANASHNDKQNPQQMIIKEIIVNQGTAYRRGMPKARGQMRPYRKFLSHIDLILGFPDDLNTGKKKSRKPSAGKKNEKAASTTEEKMVQKPRSAKTTAKTSKKKDSTESSSLS